MKKENIQPQQPSPEDKQASRGRRALHAISRSVDCTVLIAWEPVSMSDGIRPIVTRPESPLNHIRHSVRKSIGELRLVHDP